MADAPPLSQIPEGRVPIEGPDGSIGDIAASDLKSALERGGKEISHAEYDKALKTTKYEEFLKGQYGETAGPAIGDVAAFGQAGLNTLTLGGSKYATKKLLESQGVTDAGAQMAQVEGAAPTASTIGSVAGMVAPMGAVGLAGKAARAGAAGLGLEASGLVGKAATGALVGAAENAAYGTSQRIGDAVMHDEPLAAEAIFAGAGKDALLGGLIGGAVEGGLGVLGKGLSKVRGAGTAPATELAESAVSATKAADGAASQVGLLDRALQLGIGKEKGETIKDFLQRQADESLFKAAGARAKAFEKAERLGGTSGVAEVWRQGLPKYLDGEASISSLNASKFNQASERALKDFGPKYDSALSKLDEIAAKHGGQPTVNDVLNKIDEVHMENVNKLGRQPELGELNLIRNQIVEQMQKPDINLDAVGAQPISFKQLKDWKSQLGKMAFPEKNAPVKELLADATRGMDDLMTSKGDQVANLGGTTFSKEYKEIDRQYGAWKSLRDITRAGSSAASASPLVGFLDKQAGMVGAGIGGMIGGPVGAAIGGIGSTIANKLVKSRGEFFAADMLNRIAKYGAADQAAQSITTSLKNAAEESVKGSAKAIAAPIQKESVARIANDMKTLAGNPNAMSARISDLVKPLAGAAPSLAKSISMVGARAIQHLAEHAPIPKMDNSILATNMPPRYSNTELAKYNDRIETIKDPHYAFEQLRDGRLTRESVEALQAVSPALYAQMQQYVMDYVNDLKSEGRMQEMAYSKRLQLGMLLNIPVDKTQEPDFVRMMQQSAVANSGVSQDDKQQARRRGKPVESPRASATTETQRIAQGES